MENLFLWVKNMHNQYFSDLNYSLGNEDTKVEYEMVRRLKPNTIISVCGSGSRTLPLLASSPQKMICVDLASQQLGLLRLRIEVLKKLSYDEFLKFWGYAPYANTSLNRNERKAMFEKLSLLASDWEYFYHLFTKNDWDTILYEGKWEKTFFIFSRFVYLMLKERRGELFECKTLLLQKEYIKKKFPRWRWTFILFILGNRSMFNTLLYKGQFVKKNIPKGYLKFYIDAFNYLFNQILARENFFLQICFLGKIMFREANILEAERVCFDEMKSNLNQQSTEIIEVQGDLIQTICSYEQVDFISMSDVPSYFSGEQEKNFLQTIKSSLLPGAILVLRNYLRVPECDQGGYEDVTDQYRDLIAQEKVQVYQFCILRYKG